MQARHDSTYAHQQQILRIVIAEDITMQARHDSTYAHQQQILIIVIAEDITMKPGIIQLTLISSRSS